MLRLRGANTAGCGFAGTRQVGRTPLRIVSVGRKNVDKTVLKHALGPVLRLASEIAGEGAGRDLHPHTRVSKPLDDGVVAFDPGQTFGMRQHRHIARNEDVKKEIVDPRRDHMMRRFDQHIAGIAERQEMARSQPLHEVRHHVIVGTASRYCTPASSVWNIGRIAG